MNLATKIEKNNNFYIKDNKLYNVNKEEILCDIFNFNHYEYGTHISSYKNGIKVENNIFGRIEISFFNNQGDRLAYVDDMNKKHDNEVDMYVLEQGILSIGKDFSDFRVYKWTTFDGKTSVNYNFDKINNIIEKDENLGLEM